MIVVWLICSILNFVYYYLITRYEDLKVTDLLMFFILMLGGLASTLIIIYAILRDKLGDDPVIIKRTK